ncbi:MAG TPA: selenocysteine-specific translation elongation factor [Gemmatimonadaceae bacterium]|nr:selenocysteine-specific translation elongation factor [Gemmatimonadaceae bacterium]
MILGTAGHIDHGKTALVKALTGVDTDRLPEEKRRGITIDLGFAPLVVDGIGTVGIVDVPGHEAFVRTMLAGASGIDIALLVVAADEGVMPQTREHLEILSLLGIPRAVVALTKRDLVTEEWLSLVMDDVRALLSDTRFAASELVPVSAVSGAGVPELRRAIAAAALGAKERSRPADDLFRMPVDRAFTVKGTGTVVTGTVWSGMVARDATVRIFSPGKRSRVRGIQHHGEVVKSAGPGERVALALSDLDVSEVARGSVVIAEPSWPVTTRIEADVRLTATDVAIGPRTRLRFHLGTADVGARISRRVVEGFADEQHFIATIVLDEPLLVRGRDRFVLRLPSPPTTIGGGVIRDPLPPRKRRRRAASTVAARNASELLNEMTRAADLSGLPVEQVPIRLGLPPADAVVLARETGLVEIESRLYHTKVLEELEQTVQRIVLAHVENFPLEPGVQLQSLRSTAGAPDRVIDRILDQLAKKGKIEIRQSSVRPAGWSPRLSGRDRGVAEAVMHRICITPSEPPAVSELVEVFGEKVEDVLRYLERNGEVVKVSEDRYYSPDAVAKMVGKLRSTLEPGRTYSPAELREVLGVSRKYLIPFLEFCDVKGVTSRNAAGRVLAGRDAGARTGGNR